MWRFSWATLALLVSLCAVERPALADKRVALVIGNQAYNATVGPLKNPHNDIIVVGKALADVGFKLLPARKDATRDEMLFAVHDMAFRLRKEGPGAVSFLYYAGHGVAVGDENVLIPVNAEDTSDAMLSVRGVRLGEIVEILTREAPNAVHFVVLDACRNLRGQRGERGFAAVSDQRTGVVIAFSTAAGRTATDEGPSGTPYAAALADEILRPGRNDQTVFNAVRARVVEATRHRTPPQTPWTHDGLVGDRVVFSVAPSVAPEPSKVTPFAPVPPQTGEGERAWGIIKDTSSVASPEAFIQRFGETFYGELAKVRLAEVKQAAESAKMRADEEARAKAAETARLALLKQQEDDRRRAEAMRKQEEDARAAKQHLPAPVGGAAACAEKGGTQYCVSSLLPTTGVNTGHYGPRSLFDHDQATAWVEGNPGDGIGDWIVLSWPFERQLSGLRVVNGYGKNNRLFELNGRVTKARLEFSSGRSVDVSLRDTPVEQQVPIHPTVRTRWVRWQILEVVRGSKYSDTAISELSPVFE